MKTEDIKKMGLAYAQVLEKSTMDPVNPSELKGTHAQRKDKDIDNDGKVDSSDEYLHKRRQAISKAMKKEETEQTDWPVFKRIQEKNMYKTSGDDKHTKGATKAEPIDDKFSQGEKDWVKAHGGHDGNESDVDGHKAAIHTAKAATANVKAAPGRPGDQTTGDKTMPKPKG